MTYIDKTSLPHCYVVEKKFEWGEPYTSIKPIFNVGADPGLSDIEFTIELLGQNNFKAILAKLYNILLNHEEQQRLDHFEGPVTDRSLLLEKINTYLAENAPYKSPWEEEDEYGQEYELLYLEIIETELQRNLCYERARYT
ncbi:MAG: hypothetical protein BGO31_01640 [Bacteroidetes bacterium 43-16]|nr:MAG: hypothetical protein BGO31_01640 [Bacteroidetes bacterium 43-16]